MRCQGCVPSPKRTSKALNWRWPPLPPARVPSAIAASKALGVPSRTSNSLNVNSIRRGHAEREWGEQDTFDSVGSSKGAGRCNYGVAGS